MDKEFSTLDALVSLEADAQKAADLISEAGQGHDKPTPEKKPPAKKAAAKPTPEQTQASPLTKTVEVLRTRQVSTMLQIETHRRVMRAAKLQAADEKTPDSLWAILDEAANRWCDENGY